MGLKTIAAWLALAGYVAEAALFAALHVRERDVAPLRDPVSYFALGSAATLFVGYLASGALGSGFLALAMFTSPAPSVPTISVAALAGSAIARIGVALFKTGRGQWASQRDSRLHLASAILTFTCSYAAIVTAVGALANGAAIAIAVALNVLAWVAAASLVALVVTMLPRLRATFGLWERVFIVSTLSWFALAAARLV